MEREAFRQALREIYQRTLAQAPEQDGFQHSIHYFFDQYVEHPAWSIGPMEQDQSLTFRKTAQWPDPTDTGWQSGFLFNPSLIEKDGKLFLFYRAAPKVETLCSRIGLAVYTPGQGWEDYAGNPVVYPQEEDEIYGVEDPKLYKLDDGYIWHHKRYLGHNHGDPGRAGVRGPAGPCGSLRCEGHVFPGSVPLGTYRARECPERSLGTGPKPPYFPAAQTEWL